MKGFLLNSIGLALMIITLSVSGQEAKPDKLLRIYEDNDFINILGKGTDRSYSNGTRIDFFYLQRKKLRSPIYQLMPTAGEGSINTTGWGIMQVMITPTNISKTVPDENDHFYAGALFLAHNLHSSNYLRKYLVQTELVLGVMGPPALARQTQIYVHNVIGSVRPMGWDYQLPTDILINYNITVEKGLFDYKKMVELIGGAQGFSGTMHSGASLYSFLRIGKLNPYFKGFINQHISERKNLRGTLNWFILIRPGLELTMYNALLEGGFFNENSSYAKKHYKEVSLKVRRLAPRIDYGFGILSGNFSFLFTQKSMSSMIKGLPDHTVGNVSVVYAW